MRRVHEEHAIAFRTSTRWYDVWRHGSLERARGRRGRGSCESESIRTAIPPPRHPSGTAAIPRKGSKRANACQSRAGVLRPLALAGRASQRSAQAMVLGKRAISNSCSAS